MAASSLAAPDSSPAEFRQRRLLAVLRVLKGGIYEGWMQSNFEDVILQAGTDLALATLLEDVNLCHSSHQRLLTEMEDWRKSHWSEATWTDFRQAWSLAEEFAQEIHQTIKPETLTKLESVSLDVLQHMGFLLGIPDVIQQPEDLVTGNDRYYYSHQCLTHHPLKLHRCLYSAITLGHSQVVAEILKQPQSRQFIPEALILAISADALPALRTILSLCVCPMDDIMVYLLGQQRWTIIEYLLTLIPELPHMAASLRHAWICSGTTADFIRGYTALEVAGIRPNPDCIKNMISMAEMANKSEIVEYLHTKSGGWVEPVA